MVLYGLFACWIFALIFIVCCYPATCLLVFGGMLTVSLIHDAVETRRFRPW